MTITFTNARIIDPESGTETLGTVKVSAGKITEILTQSTENNDSFRTRKNSENTPASVEKNVDCGEKCLAPGIVDIGVKVSEPGERHKESFRTAGLAAAAGGITTMVTRPDTLPAIDTPEILEFVTRRANDASPVRVLPMAALTKAREGKEMVEIGFMLDVGAVAFTDCDHVIANNKVMGRCLSYAKSLGALVIGHPQDPALSAGAAVTASKFASLKGLPHVSPIAEKIGLERDLALIEMTGGRYHADQVTTSVALASMARAKEAGLDVTAGISIHHLTLNDLDVGDYRTFFKVKPPLRSEDDRIAMVQAVADGVIDVISSMHTPQDEESKRLPFEEAASGAVALETLLPAALRLYHSGDLTLPQLFAAMSLNPSKRLGLNSGRMAIGAPADLVLFDPDKPFVLDRFTLRSKSKNTPFDGQRMQGKVLQTYVAGKQVFGEGAAE